MVANTEDDEDSCGSVVNYKAQYRALKSKLKFLIYENECFQETLRSTQRRLLKASRDRSFLLDRLLSFENVEPSSSEGDETESSDDGEAGRPDPKRRKADYSSSHGGSSNSAGFSKTPPSTKKKRPSTPKGPKLQPQTQVQRIQSSSFSDGHMTAEEVERHLETKQYLDPLISESNELCKMEASPSNLTEDCLGVDM